MCFTFAFISDIFWALYISRTGDKKPLSSAVYATLLLGFAMANTATWLNDKRFVVPIILGAFAGTYLAVWREKHKK